MVLLISDMKHKRVLSELVEASLTPSCCYCGDTDIDKFSLEHLTPMVRGGTNDPENLAISCKQCNNKKSFLTDSEFRFLRTQESYRLPLFKKKLYALIDPFYEMKDSHLQHQFYKHVLKAEHPPQRLIEFTHEEILAMSLSKRRKKRHRCD